MDLPPKVFADKKLSVKEVYERLLLIAKYAGEGALRKSVGIGEATFRSGPIVG